MNKVLIILGPTATGKTDLGLFLAKKFNGELVACDSRQVYTGLDIGTGKLPSKPTYEVKRTGPRRSSWEVGGIRIWMYDVVSPRKQYTVADYVKEASYAIKDIDQRGKLPIVVGGTGLYLKGLLGGIPNLAVPVDKKLRKSLEKLSLNKLQKKLQEINSDKWQSMNQSDRQNPRRLVRAVELSMSSLRMQGSKKQTDYWIPAYAGMTGLTVQNFKVLKIGLTASRVVLYKRVDERVVSRIKQGMVEEAKTLYNNSLTLKRMKQLGLEYGVLADYLSGVIKGIQGNQGLVKVMQSKIHGYVRRQLTWFKKEKNINWFDITEKSYIKTIENLMISWYHLPYDKAN